MSDASRHNAYYIEEATYGTTPAAPTFTRLRNTGMTLGTTKTTNVSAELRSDRQIVDFRHGNMQVGGEVQFELSYGSFDDLIEAVLMGTKARKATKVAATLSFSTTDDSINDSGNGFVTAGFEAGDIVEVSGSASNSGYYQCGTTAAGKIILLNVDASPVNLTTEAAGPAVTIQTVKSIVKAGIERRSFTILRHFTDQTSGDNPFHTYKGVEFNTFSLSVAAGAIVTGSFGVLGREPAVDSTAPAGATMGNPTVTRVFDAFTGSLYEGGAQIGIVTEVSFTLENGLEPRFVVFDNKTAQPSVGRSNCTGSLTVYFEDSTMLEKFLDETDSSLAFTLTDKEGNSIRFYFPKIVYTGGQPDVSGTGPISLTMPFQAIYSAVGTELSNIIIEFFDTVEDS